MTLEAIEKRAALVAEIEARVAAAAPEPWASQATEDPPENAVVYGPDGDSFAYLTWNPGNDYDVVATADFIAHARDDIPALLAALTESRSANEELRKALEDALDLLGGMWSWSEVNGYFIGGTGWTMDAGHVLRVAAGRPAHAPTPETIERLNAARAALTGGKP